ncbi:TBCC domain-containing protein 1 [Forsythia ovata]|uniref:TBCC domain-containing protein 1 n=1 Tax=Forsythia ovata TaxID=205694 RepID=A0ABD1VNC8_9LAMI
MAKTPQEIDSIGVNVFDLLVYLYIQIHKRLLPKGHKDSVVVTDEFFDVNLSRYSKADYKLVVDGIEDTAARRYRQYKANVNAYIRDKGTVVPYHGLTTDVWEKCIERSSSKKFKKEPLTIQPNDDSKTKSYLDATIRQSLAQQDFNFPDKLDGTDNTPIASVEAVDQDDDGSKTKRMKIGLNEPSTGVNTLDDDLLFNEEGLMNMDESAEQNRLDVVQIDAQILLLTLMLNRPAPSSDSNSVLMKLSVRLYIWEALVNEAMLFDLTHLKRVQGLWTKKSSPSMLGSLIKVFVFDAGLCINKPS